jgi:O-antigen biosynthesis protein
LSNKKKLKPVKTPAKIGFLSYVGDVAGCGVIRIITPYLLLNYLKVKDVFAHTAYLSTYISELSFYKSLSFVQFQRSATEQHLKIQNHFKTNIQSQLKIPVIYEIDDLLTDIPKWNFAHSYYAENLPYIELMMKESDAIITSTHKLKKVYQKYNKNVKVIMNHLPKYIWGDIVPKHNIYKENDKIRILWAGSQNHFKHPSMKGIKDGGDFGDKLIDFIRKTTDKYQWIFMGATPIEFDDFKDKIEYHPWVDTFQYPKYVKSLNADIGIAPLSQGLFNECKSNIKSLEFCACGIPGIYSKIEPYKFMKKVSTTEEEMISQIESLADDIDLRKNVFETDYKTLKPQLWWEEDDNLKKYVNTYLSIMKLKLP